MRNTALGKGIKIQRILPNSNKLTARKVQMLNFIYLSGVGAFGWFVRKTFSKLRSRVNLNANKIAY